MWRASSKRVVAGNYKGARPGQLAQPARRYASGEKKVVLKPVSEPPLPPGGSGGVLKWIVRLLGLGAVTVGGSVVGAYLSPNFRQKVEDNVPYAKEGLGKVLPKKSLHMPKLSLPEVPKIPEFSKKSKPAPTKEETREAPETKPVLSQEQMAAMIEADEKKKIEKEEKRKQEEEQKRIEAEKQREEAERRLREEKEAEERRLKEEREAEERRLKEEAERKAAEEQALKEKWEAEQKLKRELEEKEERARKSREERIKKEEARRLLEIKEAEEAAANKVLDDKLAGALLYVSDAVGVAVDAQTQAADASRSHGNLLKKAMDSGSKDLEPVWEAVSESQEIRAKVKEEAERVTKAARDALEKMKGVIAEGRADALTEKNENLTDAEKTLNQLAYNLNTSVTEVAKAESENKIMKQYKELVEKGRVQFQKELEAITPEVQIGQEGEGMSVEDLNSLIAHAHRRVDQLQRKLIEYELLEQQHIEEALAQQRIEDEKLLKERIDVELEKAKADQSSDKASWEAEIRVEYEKDLRRQMTRQANAHQDHLQEVLQAQHQDLEKTFKNELRDRVQLERDTLQQEVSGMFARVKGLEAAIEGRAEMEIQTRDAQELWMACQALLNVLNRGKESPLYEPTPQQIADEVQAVTAAGTKHPFVGLVVTHIPEAAVAEGVWTQHSLRQRFRDVRRVGRRVALIGEEGGSVPKYLLSWLQAMFHFDTVKAKSDDDVIDLEKMDTFSLLAHADYCIEQGNLEQAVKYVNQLQGMPRVVAEDWLKDARLLLETLQVAQAISSYASASGLGARF